MNYITYTPGEPAGIGLDLIIIHAQNNITPNLLAFTDPDLLLARAKLLNLPIRLRENSVCEKNGDIAIHPSQCPNPAKAGLLNKNNARFVLDALDSAIDFVQKNTGNTLFTGPMHKGIINEAGFAFTGHTEYLASKTQCKTVMMLANASLRVALVTTHLPLREVALAITADNLTETIKILHQDLSTKFNLPNPKIAVCGLNPHAGEDGYLGDEEIRIINPVLDVLRKKGIDLSPALPADTLFTPSNLAKYDCILSMYHDQGLPVLKALGFENSVNITLGLPFVRISVDHGTALNLAGTGNISLGSFQTALRSL